MARGLLGCIGHREGYDTVKQILLGGLGRGSESYAGVALVKIAGEGAFDGLEHAIQESSSRRIWEAAAFGLGRLGLPEAWMFYLRRRSREESQR